MKKQIAKTTLIITTATILPVNANDVILTGDAGIYNNNNKIAEVNKNARVTDGEYQLTADKILHYKDKRISEAFGNVSLIDKNDKLTTADKIKLYHKTKNAVAYNANQKRDNDTYINAEKIFVYDKKNDIATNAEYSSCKIDENDKSRAWLLSVDKIVYLEDRDILEMQDVVMKVGDIPVIYIPVMQRAAPNVKRLDGWLLPNIGTNTSLGTFVVGGYYKTLPGQQDIILKPIVTSNKTVSVASVYRKKLDNSYTTVDTSLTLKDKSKKRKGHLFINNTHITKSNWKYTTKVEIANDKNYLKQHSYFEHNEKDYLKNSFKVEKNKQSSHFSLETATFRDIRQNPTPNIITTPSVIYESQIKKSDWNINTFTNVKSVNKINEHSSQNISTTVAMSQKIVTKNGIELTPNIAIRGDLVKYQYEKGYTVDKTTYKSGQKGLLTPYTSMLMSYPLNFSNKSNSFILEPVAGVFISPKRKQLNMVPKNDINDNDYFELDEHSLFSINRYSGTDRIDSGNRVSYGLKFKKWQNQNYTHAFIGQSINVYKNNTYSNFIGNVNLRQDNYRLYGQFELDNKSYQIRKLEGNGSATFGKTEFELTYTQVSPPPGSDTKKTKQLNSKAIYELNKQWSSGLESTFDFENQHKRLIRNSIIGVYSNGCGCMTTTLKYTRDYSQNINKPETTLFMQIEFKGLTKIKTTDVFKRINRK